MSLRIIVQWIMVGALLCGLSACGNRGKLKSPSQIEASEIKKENKKIKLDRKKTAEKKETEKVAESPAESVPESPVESLAESPEAQ